MPKKKKAKKGKTTMSQNVKQSVVVHVHSKTTRRQPTRSGNRSQVMSRIQTPQFVGVVGQDYSTYNNQLNNITQAIANSIKQPERTGNLITTPPRQAPDEPIHNAPSVVNMETQTKSYQEKMTDEEQASASAQRAMDASLGIQTAQSRLVKGRRAKSAPAKAKYTVATTTIKDPQTTINSYFQRANQGQETGQPIREQSRTGGRSLTREPKGTPAEEPKVKKEKTRTQKEKSEAEQMAKEDKRKKRSDAGKPRGSYKPKI